MPMDFEDRDLLEEVLTEKAGHRVEILNPQRGTKHAFLELVEKNAKHSFMQRFRVLKPSAKRSRRRWRARWDCPNRRSGSSASTFRTFRDRTQWRRWWCGKTGKMKKTDYRKFIIRGEAMPENAEKAAGILRDDFASMREVVERRYGRLQAENKALPSLILIDGGLGQLHAAAKALDKLAIINQPLASIAKKEEILYVLGREDEPVVLDHHSPVLHLVQMIRDETHRFAVTFHRQRRTAKRLKTSLTEIPGVGEVTARKLLRRFGSVAQLKRLTVEELVEEVPKAQAMRVYNALHDTSEAVK